VAPALIPGPVWRRARRGSIGGGFMSGGRGRPFGAGKIR
jgi:hypothetical protein